MDIFPAFRRRRHTGIGHYTLLDNDSDSQYSDSPRGSLAHRRHNNVPVLCDRCWAKHERNQATKRCLDCRQNLCTICAKCDEVTRPWWLPTLIAQCWRFFFSKAFIPHSFVEIHDDDDVVERRHWVHTQEASHIQPIPRVTRTSLRSNKGMGSKSTRHHTSYDDILSNPKSTRHHTSYDDILSNPKSTRHHTSYDDILLKPKPSNGETPVYAKEQDKGEKFLRSKSFEARKMRHHERSRRSRSADRYQRRHWNSDRQLDEVYESNWESGYISSPEQKNHHGKNVFSNKMKGKDVDIELTGDDVRLTINANDVKVVGGDNNKQNSDKYKCAIKKSKPKKVAKRKGPDAYTEKIFTEVPIWFKRSTTKKSSENLYDFSGRSNSETFSENATKGLSNNTPKHNIGRDINQTPNKGVNESRASRNEQQKTFHRPFHPNEIYKRGPENIIQSSSNTKYALPEASNSEMADNACGYTVEEPPDQCPICLDDLPKLESRVLRCSHQIHTKCLKQFLRSTELDFGLRCPVCNQMTMIKDYYASKELWYRELPVSTSV